MAGIRSLMLTLTLAALPQLAQAQDGVDAHGFSLVSQDGDLRDALAVHRPGRMYGGDWFASGVVEYADRTLVELEDGDDRVALGNLVAINATAGLAVHDRVRLSVGVPLFATHSVYGEAQGMATGDLRLDAMLLVVEPEDDLGLGLGLVPWMDLPTGKASSALGRRGVGGGAVAAVSYGLPSMTLLANLGGQAEPGVSDGSNLGNPDGLLGGLGVNFLVTDTASVGLEARGRTPFSRNFHPGAEAPAEAILSFRTRSESGGHLVAGVAGPLSGGVGAARFRAFLGGGFGRISAEQAPIDSDMDGIVDGVDACPDEPENYNGVEDADGCPEQARSELVVEAMWNGASRPGADIVVVTDEGEIAGVTGGEGFVTQVLPETSHVVRATLGRCLAGETTVRAGAASTRSEIPLELVPTSKLQVALTGPEGEPVEDATLRLSSDTPECVPTGRPAVGSDGTLDVEVGPGQHTVSVFAPGFRVVEQAVDVEEGETYELAFTLVPTRIEVEATRIVILDKVQFETNKASILPVSHELLDEVADVIRRNPDAGRVQVGGHTDDRGSDAHNQDLSQRRAEAVKAYLIEQGVDPSRLEARGFGESEPISSNGTPTGRAINRRVEFLLIDQQGTDGSND